MATICPALITGPEFCSRNSTATLAYLKGSHLFSNPLFTRSNSNEQNLDTTKCVWVKFQCSYLYYMSKRIFAGAEEMYEVGVLATVDVNKLAEAHVCVFEAMSRTSGGRYVCFDNVIHEEEDAEKLARATGMSKAKICGTGSLGDTRTRFQLSDRKLSSLMSTAIRPCYNQSREYSTY